MSKVQSTKSDREWEAGALRLLRARQSGAAHDATSLDDWISNDASRYQLIQELEGTLTTFDSLGDEPRIKSWLDEAHAARVTKRLAPSGFRLGTKATWALAASLVIALFAGALFQGELFHTAPAGDLIASGVNEQKQIQLADGSTIVMDAASTVRIAYTDQVRQVELLTGQAHFAVAHDPAHPFHVRLGDREVVVLGTDFNILRDGHSLQVSLFRGKVLISGLKDHSSFLGLLKRTETTPLQTLSPGQQYAQSGNHRPTLHNFDTFAVSAWEKGLVVFDNTSLEDAARALNRHSRQPLSVDSDLRSRRISGVFRSGDTVTFAKVVAGFYPHTSVEQTEAGVVLSD